MRTALSLFVTVLLSPSVRAEPPSAADFDAQIARLTPRPTRDERLAVAKWLLVNFPSKHAPRAILALEALVRKDPEPAVRRAAVVALVQIVNRHDVPCPLGLVVALRDPVDEVRWEASVLGGPFKKRLAPGAFDALRAAAGDERAEVRSTALIHLAHAAGKDGKARAAIEKAKQDKAFEVRYTAHSAWFIATDDLAALLTYMIRVRVEPKAVLNALAEGSEEANLQQCRRNLFILGSVTKIVDWTEERPDELAVALLKLLDDKSPAMRRGAVDLMGASARKVDKPRRDPWGGIDPVPRSLESLLPYLDPGVQASKEKPAPKPEPSKTYASLLARNADAKLRELVTKDPNETVRTAARRALELWREVPKPLNSRPREFKR